MMDMATWLDPPLRLDIPVRRDVVTRPPSWIGRPRHLSVAELRLAQVHLGVEDDYASEVRGLLVGMNPGPNTHPELPLFPWPATSSAGRLLEMSGMTPGEYLGGLYRRNLCDDRDWDAADAAARARELLTCLFDQPRGFRVVLCGLKVARAFDVAVEEFWRSRRLETRQRFVVIPHPSGRNLVYNDPDARQRTRAWLRWAALGEERPRRAAT